MIFDPRWLLGAIALATFIPKASAQINCDRLAALHDHNKAWLIQATDPIRLIKQYAVTPGRTLFRALFDCERSRLILLSNSRKEGAQATIYPLDSESTDQAVQVTLSGVHVINHAFAAGGAFWVFGGNPLSAELIKKHQKIDWVSAGLRPQEKWFSGAFGFDSVTGEPTDILPMPGPASRYIRKFGDQRFLFGSNPPFVVDMKRYSASRALKWRIMTVPYPIQNRAIAQFVGDNAFYVEGSRTGPGSKPQIRRYVPAERDWATVATLAFDPHFFHFQNDRIVLVGDQEAAIFKNQGDSLHVSELPFESARRSLGSRTFSAATVKDGYLLTRVRRVGGKGEATEYSSVVTVYLLSHDLTKAISSLELRPISSSPQLISPQTISSGQYGDM